MEKKYIYKNLKFNLILIQKFISDKGKIFHNKIIFLSKKEKKIINKLIKQMRILSLIPF